MVSPTVAGYTWSKWTQRNWSRVGVAIDRSGARVFAKQFVDADGVRLVDLFHAEIRTASLLASSDIDGVTPLTPVGVFEAELMLLYPYIDDLVTLDVQAASAGAQGLAVISRALGQLATATESLERSSPSCADVEPPAERRALAWKGLDVKNLSMRADGSLLVFDFGPTYQAALADPVARLVASALVANWGMSLRRIIAGPPAWAGSFGELLDMTTRAHVHRRLDRLLAHRLDEPKTSGVVERIAIPPATRILAPRYWRLCHEWVEENVPDVEQTSAVANVTKSAGSSRRPAA